MEHALLENKVKFQNLGLAVIDEHAFFGVGAAGSEKTQIPPHVLKSNDPAATPIPRTLSDEFIW
jgi:ATP-dependent DNA helicase RecG